MNNIDKKKEREYSHSFNICIQNMVRGEVLVHPGLQGSCGDLVLLTEGQNRRSVNPKLNLTGWHWTCDGSTYMTWTTTPMPDTASLSTALSIAWEMVSNRSSGSCAYQGTRTFTFSFRSPSYSSSVNVGAAPFEKATVPLSLSWLQTPEVSLDQCFSTGG